MHNKASHDFANEGQRTPYTAHTLAVQGATGVLVLAPHPDDEVFGCGGAAALFAQAGIAVQALLLTDGGLWGVPPAGVGIAQARLAEATAAAAVLGCQPPLSGGYADRGLTEVWSGSESRAALVASIVACMQASRANVLFAPSLWEVHPDHRAAALAALAALEQLGEGHTLVQYEVGAALLPNVLVDISPVLARKQQAIACFASQLAVQRYDRHVQAMNVFRTYTLPEGVLAAEALRVASPAEAKSDPYGLHFQGCPHPLVAELRQQWEDEEQQQQQPAQATEHVPPASGFWAALKAFFTLSKS